MALFQVALPHMLSTKPPRAPQHAPDLAPLHAPQMPSQSEPAALVEVLEQLDQQPVARLPGGSRWKWLME